MSSSGTTGSPSSRRGFVLATTLLVTTLLTVMLAASFLLVSAEQRTTDNSLGTARALALAQAGLQNYFSQNRSLADTSTYDSMRIALVNGYADVVARKVRRSGASTGSPLALWVVRSAGVSTSQVMAGQVVGSRTVAQFTQLNLGTLPARSNLIALNGVQVTGAGSNPLSGSDIGNATPCTSPGHPMADTVAVSIPSGMYGASTGGAPTGTIESFFPTWSSLYDSTHVDWAGLLGGNFLPDYTVTSASPVSAWPPILSFNYLVGYVPPDGSGNPQDITIPTGQRRGMLVVTGNVRIAGGAHWDGVLLVGGNLTVPVGLSYFLHGMVVTGLNIAQGQSVSMDTLPRTSSGIVPMQWSWCYTQSSIGSLSSLVPMKNTWADTWATY
jgi:Tfp pilus assembly protein PilX